PAFSRRRRRVRSGPPSSGGQTWSGSCRPESAWPRPEASLVLQKIRNPTCVPPFCRWGILRLETAQIHVSGTIKAFRRASAGNRAKSCDSIRFSIVLNQARQSCDENRAQQPSGHDLQPQIVAQDRAADRNSPPEHRALARRRLVRPPVMLLMEVYERQENVERVQQRIQTGDRVFAERCYGLRPRQAHHARPRADRNQHCAQEYDRYHPKDGAQRRMSVADGDFQKLAPCSSYRIGAAVERIVARDEHRRGGTHVADAAVV